ncbi:hypothetical protein JI739_04590 [Ramlibacter sp. AW1]|uniref:Uncharacterized protein n=1 Tax=Ramlibacter aurantiacus TaxID=2801330 RepID=A0A936ZEU2_9BURK|nr:hypothetical protein [Ramlibacter aurantiacus]MBL0419622.1 hypothetical protein [Ramlibacter aurantiacus]
MTATDQALLEIVFTQWPELATRLGERRADFTESAVRRARQFGLDDEGSAARYLNLCLALGPGFEARPENEWALATLSDARLSPATRIHQLVIQAVTQLKRKGGEADRFRASDEALLDGTEDLRRREGAEPPLVPRRACDLEAVQVGVTAASDRTEYARTQGAWQRRSRQAASRAIVADAEHPLPAVIHVLADAEPDRVTQLQVRQRPHASCGEHHPALCWIDERGIQRWSGHAAQVVTWPVRPPPPPRADALALLAEAPPSHGLLEAGGCGVRDTGIPLGAQRTRVSVYPAHQHLFALQRAGGAAFRLGEAAEEPSAPPASPAGKYRLERDGQVLHASRWSAAFDLELPQAVGRGLARLYEAWRACAAHARVSATEHLLAGRAALAWGWREGARGLAGEPVSGAEVDLDLRLGLELELSGTVSHAGVPAVLRLRAGGSTPLRFDARRDTPEQPLLQAFLSARGQARWPFTVSCEPVPSDDCALWHDLGPCPAAITAEAGLRPRQAGGAGWEFFLRLDLEPVVLPLRLHDPVLGMTWRRLALLPAMRLVDWSAG